MKIEAILDKAVLTKTGLRDVSRTTTAACPAPGDLWRRARACWDRMLRLRRRAPRRLRLCESLSLGERRVVAVVEFEHSRFLVGGTSASLVLLARLGDAADDEIMGANQPTDFRGGGK